MYTDRISGTPAIVVNVKLDGKEVSMELDTGAAMSVMSEAECVKHFPKVSFRKADVKLEAYNGTPVPIKGIVDVTMQYHEQCLRLPLVIAKENQGARMPSLFGRNGLEKIKIKGFKAGIVLKEAACPVFCKSRSVPYALREQVEKEVVKLEKAGIIYRIRHSSWATPLVIVPEKNGIGLRMSGDYRCTVNGVIELRRYPLPLPEDISAALQGRTVFSVIDLSQAYLQLELDEPAQELLTVNTNLGLFSFRRLPYGVASALAFFQAVMNRILQGMPGTACYLDDVIIAGKTQKEPKERVEQVLTRVSTHEINVNADKFRLFKQTITYLGHGIDMNGLHPTSEKVLAINNVPKPVNGSQLKAFLGLVNFYAKVLPKLATVLEPLHQLRRKESAWN